MEREKFSFDRINIFKAPADGVYLIYMPGMPPIDLNLKKGDEIDVKQYILDR